MKSSLLILLLTGAALAEEVQLTSLEAFITAAGWIEVEDVEASSKDKIWTKIKPGNGVLVNGNDGKAGNLISQQKFGDVEAIIEFMIPSGSNSGIYLQSRYEVQILDSASKPHKDLTVHDCGAIYERWDEKREPKGYEGKVPDKNASRPPGRWQNFHIVFRAPRFNEHGQKTENARFVKVVHNGVLIHENVAVTGPTRGGEEKESDLGPIKIQGDHGPVAFRKILIKSLTL